MIIFRGRGIVIAGIAVGCLLAAEVYTRARFHDDDYYQQHGWPKLAAFALAALVTWWLSPPPVPSPQPLHSPETGISTPSLMNAPIAPERSSFRVGFFRPQDSLFYVPARFWPPILCALGLLFYFIPAGSPQ